jgi:hypothetical protein
MSNLDNNLNDIIRNIVTTARRYYSTSEYTIPLPKDLKAKP